MNAKEKTFAWLETLPREVAVKAPSGEVAYTGSFALNLKFKTVQRYIQHWRKDVASLASPEGVRELADREALHDPAVINNPNGKSNMTVDLAKGPDSTVVQTYPQEAAPVDVPAEKGCSCPKCGGNTSLVQRRRKTFVSRCLDCGAFPLYRPVAWMEGEKKKAPRRFRKKAIRLKGDQ